MEESFLPHVAADPGLMFKIMLTSPAAERPREHCEKSRRENRTAMGPAARIFVQLGCFYRCDGIFFTGIFRSIA
jgi:hypothetical protein